MALTPHGWAHADDGTACYEPAWCQRDHVRAPQAEGCADCGARNPRLVDIGSRKVCEHRYACEARQMLARGAPVEAAAVHAQKPRPW